MALALLVSRSAQAVRTIGPEADADTGGARRSSGEGRSERKTSADNAQQSGRGRRASSPQEIPAQGWWDILKRVYGEVDNDRILAVAAGVTFYGLLATFPAIAAFVSLYGLVADASTINDHLSTVGSFMPGGAIEIVSDQVKRITARGNSTLGFTFFSGLAVSLWSANAGMKAIFDALNVAFEQRERRNFIVLNLWSLGFTVGAIVFLGLAITSVVVIPIVLKMIGLGGIVDWLVWAGRWPALLIVTLCALALLYRYAPSRERAQWRWVTPGSILAAVGWLAFSMLFSWYVSSFGNYNETYGSLGAAIGFMTWMWLSVTIVLVGAELNAETEHQTAQDTTDGPGRPLGSRGATMADKVAPASA